MPKEQKPQQAEIPMEGKGVAPVKIPKLDKLARQYVQDRDARILALQHEVESKHKLSEAMHFHSEQVKTPDGLLMYHFDDQVIVLEPGKEKLSVRASHVDDETE